VYCKDNRISTIDKIYLSLEKCHSSKQQIGFGGKLKNQL